jgi:hypothetical protein
MANSNSLISPDRYCLCLLLTFFFELSLLPLLCFHLLLLAVLLGLGPLLICFRDTNRAIKEGGGRFAVWTIGRICNKLNPGIELDFVIREDIAVCLSRSLVRPDLTLLGWRVLGDCAVMWAGTWSVVMLTFRETPLLKLLEDAMLFLNRFKIDHKCNYPHSLFVVFISQCKTHGYGLFLQVEPKPF